MDSRRRKENTPWGIFCCFIFSDRGVLASSPVILHKVMKAGRAHVSDLWRCRKAMIWWSAVVTKLLCHGFKCMWMATLIHASPHRYIHFSGRYQICSLPNVSHPVLKWEHRINRRFSNTITSSSNDISPCNTTVVSQRCLVWLLSTVSVSLPCWSYYL